MTIDDIKAAFCQDDDYNIFKDVINHMNNDYDTACNTCNTCTTIYNTDDTLYSTNTDRKDYVINKPDDQIDSWLPYFNVFEDDYSFDESDEAVDESVEEAITEEYDDFYDDIRYAYT